jgi:predicted ATPase
MFARHVEIENWKNFRHGTLDLGDRLFIIGPNASGKSNLLDAFRFLRDLVAAGGGLQRAVESRGGVSGVRCLAARRHSDLVIDVGLDDGQGENWRYRLAFSQDNQRRPVVKTERVERNGDLVLDRPDAADKGDGLRLTETALEQTSANREFRPIVSFFGSISYQHLLPQVVRDPAGFSPGRVENDPYGRDFLQRVENTPQRTRDARLRHILAALKVAAPQLQDLRVERDAVGVPHLVGLFEHWRPQAGRQSEAQFSDGTLRLFGMLWTLFEGDGLLLMEEPELSLHPGVVRYLPQMIHRINRQRKIRRQVIISTHSEEMLRDPGIQGEEVVRLEPSSEGTRLCVPARDPEERAQLEAGLTIADVVLPKSAPKAAHQLSLFQ